MTRSGEEPKETKYEKVFVGKIPIMLRFNFQDGFFSIFFTFSFKIRISEEHLQY